MKKLKSGQEMRIAKGACPAQDCKGDLFLDYKGGSRYKCLKCSRIYLSAEPVPYYKGIKKDGKT